MLPEITAKLKLDLPADAPVPTFHDASVEAGLESFRSFAGVRTSQLPEDMGAGAAWGDYDADGDDDLFLVSAGGSLDLEESELAPSELYENLGDGTFEKEVGFPETRIRGMGAAWGDYDSDGRLDLVVSGYRTLLLFHNDGDRFSVDQRLELPSDVEEGFWAGVSWADIDNDRDLDLYICGYVRYEVGDEVGGKEGEQYGRAVPYTLNPASFEPERNLLFRNRLDEATGEFSEEARLLGISNPEGRSLSALWHDFDSDGRLDLYVANDISDNALFLNRPDGFEDAGLAAWVADYRGAMGLAAGDWNRDGDDDLFVTHWVAQENALYDSRLVRVFEDGESKPGPGRLTFSDIAVPLGLGQIALHRIGWGTEFLDFDHDGWLDLVVANGSTFEAEDRPEKLRTQQPFLFWNQRGESFHDVAPLATDLSREAVGRGLATSDYDNDGDVDLLFVDLDGGVGLLRNELRSDANWIELRLRHRVGSKGDSWGSGEGATVTIHHGGVEQRRSVTGASYLSQSSRTLHFGLGTASSVDRVEVAWLGGERQIYTALAAGVIWRLDEGDPEAKRVAVSALPQQVEPVDGADGERRRVVEFWAAQRAAMDAMKREGDPERAIVLFREALALDPEHQDSRYYLANLLADRGDTAEALDELDRLLERDPQSHRGHKQRGILSAQIGRAPADLESAERSLLQAHAINREETGALLALGEVALLRGDTALARERLELVNQTNSRDVGALYLRAYLAWKRSDDEDAVKLLAAAREALGPDWKPAGATAEGDVLVETGGETSVLSHFWNAWDGTDRPRDVFAELDRFVGG